MTNLCTLFDSNYLDKGLVLYKSLSNVSEGFCLYILAMDDKCYEVLCNLRLDNIIPIKLEDIEGEDLLIAKSNRSRGEYCWTCTSSFLYYLFKKYNLDFCTYIDADMYFYQDPQILINEMVYSNASALIVKHGFEDNGNLAKKVGTYCVEFNSFRNDEVGMSILQSWIKDCLECCSVIGDGIHWGDQKYLDKWVPLYGAKVRVLENLGGGVARWNIAQYRYITTICNDILMKDKKTNKTFKLCFYHFDNLRYSNRNQIAAPIFLDSTNTGFLKSLYANYLIDIEEQKRMLEYEYGIKILITSHPAIKKIEKNTIFYLKKLTYFISHPKDGILRIKAINNGMINI